MLRAESQPLTHPVQSGLNYVDYTVSHFLDKVPDKIKVYKLESNVWRSIGKLNIGDGGTPEEGYLPITTTGTAEAPIRVYKISEQEMTIKFVCLDLT